MIGMAAFFGKGSEIPAPTYDLSDLATTNMNDTGFAIDDYSTELRIFATTDGSIDILKLVNADILNCEQYITPATGQDLWVNVTYQQAGGTALASITGDSTGTWIKLDVTRSWEAFISMGSITDYAIISWRVRLSDDSSGSNVVADTGAFTPNFNIGNPP